MWEKKSKGSLFKGQNEQFSPNERAGPTYNIKDYDLVEDNLAIYILKSISILHFLLSNAIKTLWNLYGE